MSGWEAFELSEKYLIDANSLIRPARAYYPFDFAPSFWQQLRPKISLDKIAVLDKVRDEVLKGTDELSAWISDLPNECILSTQDMQILQKYRDVLSFIQQSDKYSEAALRRWSQLDIADPWLIAAAKVYGYTLLSFEQSAGTIPEGSRSKNPKLPDVARHFQVPYTSLFDMMRNESFIL
ncbi:PIN domain protein [Centipeda periodontii DSM 2778]|uniref:PIN domain protein n=1 Tax=Centipeda periodontii DSM 2778 TaxID=888060 RepID=F5RJC8_9FIRM|nr:PIN domain protein [Centipeda periodontii DSM 2778]